MIYLELTKCIHLFAGDGSAATAASVYMEPLESDLLTMKLLDITMLKFNIKTPHGSGSIFKMKFIPCKKTVWHGQNPCKGLYNQNVFFQLLA